MKKIICFIGSITLLFSCEEKEVINREFETKLSNSNLSSLLPDGSCLLTGPEQINPGHSFNYYIEDYQPCLFESFSESFSASLIQLEPFFQTIEYGESGITVFPCEVPFRIQFNFPEEFESGWLGVYGSMNDDSVLDFQCNIDVVAISEEEVEEEVEEECPPNDNYLTISSPGNEPYMYASQWQEYNVLGGGADSYEWTFSDSTFEFQVVDNNTIIGISTRGVGYTTRIGVRGYYEDCNEYGDWYFENYEVIAEPGEGPSDGGIGIF